MGKVVFTGIGADELFGGYKRHISKWKHGLLEQEMRGDIARIAYRNNGRDDRVAGHFGVEVRHPFLDHALVVDYALQCDLAVLLDFTKAAGGKIVLRNLIRQLGFPDAIADQDKKAMQFGSDINRLLKQSLHLKKLDGRMQMKDLIQ